MPVMFSRDISRLSEFISVWYGDSSLLKIPDYVGWLDYILQSLLTDIAIHQDTVSFGLSADHK